MKNGAPRKTTIEVQTLSRNPRTSLACTGSMARPGTGEFDLGLSAAVAAGRLPIVSTQAEHLWDALCRALRRVGFGEADGGDVAFRHLVLARILEPTSKLASLRVLTEVGVELVSYATLKRHLPPCAEDTWRQTARDGVREARGAGPASLVPFEVSTLYFETDQGDQLSNVTVVADPGMVSDVNKKANGLPTCRSSSTPGFPRSRLWWPTVAGSTLTPKSLTGRCSPSRGRPAPPTSGGTTSSTTSTRPTRARRTLRGIDQQITEAEKAVAGKEPVKRNRFMKLTGAKKSINRVLEAKVRGLAGLKGYVTNLENPTPDCVIDAYHRLWDIEKSFPMSQHDLRARPIYHHKRESIEAHLTVVFVALAVSRLLGDRTGWSIRKFLRSARRHRTVQIHAGEHLLTVEDPLPPELRDALALIC